MDTIVIATDLSSRAERAHRMGVLLARQAGARLRFVYGIDNDQPANLVKAQSDQAWISLQRLADTVERFDGIDCSAEVATGDGIAEAITACVPSSASLLILGSHRRRPVRDLFLGGTPERLVAQRRVPVLVVRQPPVEVYRRMLFATDLSDASMAVARRIADHPVTGPLAKIVLTVAGSLEQSPVTANRMSDPAREEWLAGMAARAEAALERFIERARMGVVTPRVEATTQPTAAAIVEAARHEGADLIAVSPSEAQGLESFLRESVTVQLLNSAPMDVMVL
ncbi:universal stress protein [Spiribacter sp. 218]|uniref:universal stress protein n=1 Tax=Spiribacter pallidus TaxID=1987936 RepID=UPI00349F97A1